MLFTFKYLVIYTDIYTKDDLKRKSLYVAEYEWPRKRLIYYVHGIEPKITTISITILHIILIYYPEERKSLF